MRQRLVEATSLPDLADTIRSALNAQSCLIDLRQSAGGLLALNESIWNDFLGNQVAPSEEWLEVVQTALLEGAVSLYVRATHSGSKNGSRGSIQIVSQLSCAEKEDHKTIINVRNDAIAHVHQNKNISGLNRHRGAVLLVESKGGWRPGAAASRVTFDRHLLGCLTRQLPVATRLISGKVDKWMREIAELMTRYRSDADLQDAIKDSEVNLPEFFGSETKAMKAVAGLNAGSVTFKD